jgi:hypothetical protein
MLVPEAAVDKKGGAPGTENEIGFAGKIATLQAVAETKGSHQLADDFFGFCVLAPDAGHVPGTFLRCEEIA